MPSVKIRKYQDSVYVIYSHKNQKFKVFTGLKVEDQFWNLGSPKKNCPNYDRAVLQITEMETRVLNASMKIRSMGIEPTVARVHAEFHAQLAPALEKQPFWETYTTYLDLLPCKEGSRRKIKMTRKVLEYFCTWSGYHFDIATFDRITFGRFVQYMLLNQKMADSTINQHVKWLRAFLKYAYPLRDMSWMRYLMLTTEEEVIALSEGELRFLIDADLGGYLETTRDLFVFLATTGMRFSDSQLFDPHWVTDEKILEFTQLKTGGKAYPPLYEASRRVLLKYNGIPPQISNQKFNDYLKELFEELEMKRPVTIQTVKGRVVCREIFPLYSVISSHTARRTFITLCLEKGMPIQDVMKMSGHSDYKSMKPYIRVTLKHLRTVADKWEI
jgi:site-specific recombinase XerD